ncbi:MAG: hypothetical protein ACLSUW_05395 [Akkermansia sp.]
MAPDLKSGSFWSSSREDLFGKYFNGEAGGWVDKEKTQLRMARPRIKIGEISLGETLVNWKDNTPQSMTVMIYNKGDNGAIDRDEFEARLERVKAALDTLTGVKSKEYRASRREAVVKVNGWSWVWDKGAAVVEANSSRGPGVRGGIHPSESRAYGSFHRPGGHVLPREKGGHQAACEEGREAHRDSGHPHGGPGTERLLRGGYCRPCVRLLWNGLCRSARTGLLGQYVRFRRNKHC